MMGKYKRKTNRASYKNIEIKDALKMIIGDKCSIREAAVKTGIPRQTLNDKFLQLKNLCGSVPKVEDIEKLTFGYQKPRQVRS